MIPYSLDHTEDILRQTADTPQSWPYRGQAGKLLTPHSLDHPQDKQANCWHPTVLTIQRASRQTADTPVLTTSMKSMQTADTLQSWPTRGQAGKLLTPHSLDHPEGKQANCWHLTDYTTQRICWGKQLTPHILDHPEGKQGNWVETPQSWSPRGHAEANC